MEQRLLVEWGNRLATELGIYPNDNVDAGELVALLNALLGEWRVQAMLSVDRLVIDSTRMLPNGELISEPRLNPLVVQQEKLAAKRKQALDSLVATREAKSKARRSQEQNAAQMVQSVIDAARLLSRNSAELPRPKRNPHGFSTVGNIDGQAQFEAEFTDAGE